MKLTPPQQKISLCDDRFRVVAAGRRFGKSFLSINELAKFASQPNRRCMYVAPTYRQAKTVIWDDLKGMLLNVHWVKKINESELMITLVNNSVITIRSTDNYDALRGGKYDFIVLDECADMAPEAWFTVLRPTLSDRGGHALFIGSPKGRNWFYDLWMECALKSDWQAFQFTTLEGGNVPPEEIEAAKRDLDEKTFEQEYLAQFVNYAGVIFYAYDDEANRIPYDTTHFTPRTPLHIGMDFNNNPMSAVVCVKGADWLHVIDEIEIYGSNTYEMVTELRNRYGSERQMYVYPDATGKRTNTNSGGMSDHIILQNNGFKVVTDKSNPNVLDSISSVNALLCNSEGERNLLIDPGCRKTRECMLKYVFKPDTRVPDKDSGFDHMADALRYVTYKLFPIRQLAVSGHKSYRRI